MGKLRRLIARGWRLYANVDAFVALLGYLGVAHLAWGLLVAVFFAMIAYFETAPWWAIGLIALAAFLLVEVAFAIGTWWMKGLPTLYRERVHAFDTEMQESLVATDAADAEVISRGGSTFFPATVTQTPAPNLTGEEKSLAKDALAHATALIDGEIAPLQRESRWLGSAPQKHAGRTDDLPPLRDSARDLAVQTRDFIENHQYGLHLAGVSLAFLVERLNALEGGVQGFWSKLKMLRGQIEPEWHSMVNEWKEPAVRANGELGNAIAHARKIIRDARNQIEGQTNG